MLLLDIKEMVMYMLFLVALSIVSGVLIVKHTKTAIKVFLMVAVVALSLVGIAYGEKEQPVETISIEVEVINVEKVKVDNETLWRAEFEYQDDVLSWYEDEEVFVGDIYNITLYGDEVIDAEPVPSLVTMMLIFRMLFW